MNTKFHRQADAQALFIISERRPIRRLVNIGLLFALSKRDARMQAAHKWPGRSLMKPRPWSAVKPARRLFVIIESEK